MTQYLKPEREELEYRKKLLGSSCSMSWNHGTISFPEEEWDHYLDQYVNSDGSSALLTLEVDHNRKVHHMA